MEIKITPLSIAVFSRKEIRVTTKARDLDKEKQTVLAQLKDMGHTVNPLVYWREGGLTAEIVFPIIAPPVQT